MYTSMLDQQISQNLAKRGMGLADVLMRQLSNNAAGPTLLPAPGSRRRHGRRHAVQAPSTPRRT